MLSCLLLYSIYSTYTINGLYGYISIYYILILLFIIIGLSSICTCMCALCARGLLQARKKGGKKEDRKLTVRLMGRFLGATALLLFFCILL